jgi:hypothetical protein
VTYGKPGKSGKPFNHSRARGGNNWSYQIYTLPLSQRPGSFPLFPGFPYWVRIGERSRGALPALGGRGFGTLEPPPSEHGLKHGLAQKRA